MVQRLVAEEIETVVEDQLETEGNSISHGMPWACQVDDLAKVQGELQDHQTVRGK